MSKEKIDIENHRLKESPFEVPANYFPALKNLISDKISANQVTTHSRISYIWSRVRYVAAISVALIGCYIVISPLETDDAEYASPIADIIENGFLNTSFIDFFDADADMSEIVIDENSITDDEIISYLSENAGIILLASLD